MALIFFDVSRKRLAPEVTFDETKSGMWTDYRQIRFVTLGLFVQANLPRDAAPAGASDREVA